MTPTFTTYTKRCINPLEIKPEDICIEDIAHHLALVNRFNGATKKPLSVAQHSIYVYRLCLDSGYERHALFHDGSEAYLGDVTKWLKESPAMTEFRRIEDEAQKAINQVFLCPWEHNQMPAKVRWADKLMVRFEAYMNDLTIHQDGYEKPTEEEMDLIGSWAPWDWRMAREGFLVAYHEILRAEGEGRLAAHP